MKKYVTKLFSLLMALCIANTIFVSSAWASGNVDAGGTASKYDFSAEDALDKYDQYIKDISDGTILPEGTEYVEKVPHNSVNTINPVPIGTYRRSAYLRSPDERQHYSFFNFKYSGDGVIPQNVLTIYADPEVNFELRDISGLVIANNRGVQIFSEIAYYNKTVDNGHNVYYIELEPDETGKSDNMITFTTDSTTVQPHYSFWFGAPLMETATVAGSPFSIRIAKPNTNSDAVIVTSPYGVPAKRAWVHTVEVDQISQRGAENASRKRMNVIMPGGKASTVAQYIADKKTSVKFEVHPSAACASPASGTYKFQLTDVSWKAGAAASASYICQGRMILTYIYAFGA